MDKAEDATTHIPISLHIYVYLHMNYFVWHCRTECIKIYWDLENCRNELKVYNPDVLVSCCACLIIQFITACNLFGDYNCLAVIEFSACYSLLLTSDILMWQLMSAFLFRFSKVHSHSPGHVNARTIAV